MDRPKFTNEQRQTTTEAELIENSLQVAEYCRQDTGSKLVCHSCFEDMMANLLRLREIRGKQ